MAEPCHLRSGFYLSRKHVSIAVRRVPVPGATPGTMMLRITYGRLTEKKWNPLHYPDVARINPTVRRVMDHLLNDRDNLGLPLGQPMPKGCTPFKKKDDHATS